MLDLSPSRSPADTLHQRFLDAGLPAALSTAAFAAFDRAAYSEGHLRLGKELWQRRALDEYRSLAAFSQLLAVLTEMGLHFDVLGACIRVVRDEARHVELCRRMVRTLGGDDCMPGTPDWVGDDATLPLKPRALRTILGSLCIAETFSARLIAASCEFTDDPLARAANQCFAADEAVHSLLGWTLLELFWPSTDGPEREDAGRVARLSLEQCEVALEPGRTTEYPAHPFGGLPSDVNARVYQACRADVMQRLRALGVL